MFGWFKKKKPDPVSDLALSDLATYKPSERVIFEYWNGKDIVREDPLVLYERFMKHYAELKVEIQVAESPSKNAAEMQLAALERIQDIFKVKSLGGDGGLTRTETMDLLGRFMDYVTTVKKNSERYQALFPPIPDSQPSSSEKDQPTSSSSDYGSTEKPLETSEPTRSPQESVSA
jgi:hypothetical protein